MVLESGVARDCQHGGGGARRGSEATESWGGSRYIGRFLKIVYQIAIFVYIKCHYEVGYVQWHIYQCLLFRFFSPINGGWPLVPRLDTQIRVG